MVSALDIDISEKNQRWRWPGNFEAGVKNDESVSFAASIRLYNSGIAAAKEKLATKSMPTTVTPKELSECTSHSVHALRI